MFWLSVGKSDFKITFYFSDKAEELIDQSDIPDDVKQHKNSLPAMKARASLKSQVSQLEKDIILKALQDFNGNKRKTAQHLGIQRSVLYIKLKKYGLE